jgi:hypothetical protein
MTKTLNSAPTKIDLPDLAQAVYEEIQKNSNLKIAYAFLVSYILKKDFSVHRDGENAVSSVENLLNAYKNLPENLESLEIEDKIRAEAIRKTMEKIDNFFAEYNNKYGNETRCLSLEEMFRIFESETDNQKEIKKESLKLKKGYESLKFVIGDSINRLKEVLPYIVDLTPIQKSLISRFLNSCMYHSDIKTFTDLADYSWFDLRRNTNMGASSMLLVKELLEVLMEKGVLHKVNFRYFLEVPKIPR